MIDFTLSKAQEAFRNYAHQVAVEEMRPISLECDRSEKIPESFFWNMQKRFWGGSAAQVRMQAKEEENQENMLSMLSQEEMAWGDAALATAIPGPGLAAPPILSQGTPEQQRKFLSLYMDGQLHWGALALTEPGIGSDVAGMSTTATLDGDEWVINGHKHYITNGARADLIITFATIDKRLGREGIRPFVVPKGTPGLVVGRIEEKMGLRASQTAELILENCRIPKENLLSGRGQQDKKAGFRAAMGTLDATRPMVGALAVGIARAAYETTSQWVQEELPKGYPAQKRREIEEELEELRQELQMARFLVWRAAWMADQRIPNSKEASMCKAYAGGLLMKVTAAGVRITAPGESSESKQFLHKWFRDAKVFDIFEGTAQIQRLIIARRMFPGVDIP
ncbi:MAG TPA: acyl-CoA dehydrogenase family protein [Ktedonobacteraceae bacterium]|nr:acyl-CoA dehydrogenase family protein [Ktedonobacteraceae bacterium]